MPQPDPQHTLTSILSDGLALGYFTQHLQEQRSARSLQFYIMCRGIREVSLIVSVRYVCIQVSDCVCIFGLSRHLPLTCAGRPITATNMRAAAV